jgi:hypothetical protein
MPSHRTATRTPQQPGNENVAAPLITLDGVEMVYRLGKIEYPGAARR